MSLYNVGKHFKLLVETLQKIEGHLSWIASCHYKEFEPKVNAPRPDPYVAPRQTFPSYQRKTSGTS